MIPTVIALTTIGLLIGMSVRANARFRTETQLPMQWSLDGSVNWRAPRAVALALLPAAASVALIAIAGLSIFATPRAGQEGMVIPAVLLVAGAFLGAHRFHIWLIERTLAKGKR